MTCLDGIPTIEIIYRDRDRTMRVEMPVRDSATVVRRLGALGAVTQSVGPALTERECQVMRGVCKGWPNRRIASELGISEATVRRHVSNILAKKGLESRTQLALALGA